MTVIPRAPATEHLSASFSATIRVGLENRPGAFAEVAAAIADEGGLLDAIDLVRVEDASKVRDVTVLATDADHLGRIVDAVRDARRRRGRARLRPDVPPPPRRQARGAARRARSRRATTSPWHTRRELRASAVRSRTSRRRSGTSRSSSTRSRSSPTAPPCWGSATSAPRQPSRSWRARQSSSRSSEASTRGPSASRRRTSTRSSPPSARSHRVFGGINLEDISAPRCFEIEDRLRAMLDIPVFHDDQHGTAVVVLAALLNALKVVDKRLDEISVVVTGVGAAGVATTKMLLAAGVRDVIGCDRQGVIWLGRPGLDGYKLEYALSTNPRGVTGSAGRSIAGRGRVHRPLRAGRRQPGGRPLDGARRNRLCNGEPHAGGAPGGDRRLSDGDRHRPLGLSEPDQQCPRLPRHHARRPRRAGDRRSPRR